MCWLSILPYNENDQVNEYEMDRACSTHRTEEDCIQGFGVKARRKETVRKTKMYV
jgi:hypothetical protein